MTRDIDTFIEQEVGNMVDSIDKAHKKNVNECDDNGSEQENDHEENYESDYDDNLQSNRKKRQVSDRKRRKRVDNIINQARNKILLENDEQIICIVNEFDDMDFENKSELESELEFEQESKLESEAESDYESDYNDDHRKKKRKNVYQSEDTDEEEGSDESDIYNYVDKKLFCENCETAGHVSEHCSLYSSRYFINMRKHYSSVVVECALRQLLDSIGFIFQSNIKK